MAEAWLSLGANIGNPAAQLEEALMRLGQHREIKIAARSSLLVNPAWGKIDQNPFHNLVLGIETSLCPEALLQACLKIETDMGRVRQEKWGPRLIDIDLIAYEREVMASPSLVLPHPFAHQRAFVIDLLREIAPDTADWIMELADSPQ
jgi:2-amino-4-hydroxy-6-hydroxymethyldihydropteridine diphosphokinase